MERINIAMDLGLDAMGFKGSMIRDQRKLDEVKQHAQLGNMGTDDDYARAAERAIFSGESKAAPKSTPEPKVSEPKGKPELPAGFRYRVTPKAGGDSMIVESKEELDDLIRQGRVSFEKDNIDEGK